MTSISPLMVALYAPLGAVSKRHPSTLHAATMEAIVDATIKKPKRLIVGACGARGLVLPAEEWDDGAVSVILWPPAIKDIAPNVRCRECWVATGKRSPRKAKNR